MFWKERYVAAYHTRVDFDLFRIEVEDREVSRMLFVLKIRPHEKQISVQETIIVECTLWKNRSEWKDYDETTYNSSISISHITMYTCSTTGSILNYRNIILYHEDEMIVTNFFDVLIRNRILIVLRMLVNRFWRFNELMYERIVTTIQSISLILMMSCWTRSRLL